MYHGVAMIPLPCKGPNSEWQMHQKEKEQLFGVRGCGDGVGGGGGGASLGDNAPVVRGDCHPSGGGGGVDKGEGG